MRLPDRDPGLTLTITKQPDAGISFGRDDGPPRVVDLLHHARDRAELTGEHAENSGTCLSHSMTTVLPAIRRSLGSGPEHRTQLGGGAARVDQRHISCRGWGRPALEAPRSPGASDCSARPHVAAVPDDRPDGEAERHTQSTKPPGRTTPAILSAR